MTSTLHDEPQEAIPAPYVDDDPHSVIRVLHVDDDANQLIFTKRFLEEMDPTMWVESVASPEEALRLLQEQSFDCVVSDYVMPGLDGVELAYRIRETSVVPMIIYTGKGSEEVAERAFAAGVDDYLRKELDPSHYQVLAKRIKHAVEKHRTENVYQHVTNESLDAIVILDGTRIVFANQAQADLYGVDGPGDLIGRDVTEWNTDPERVRRMALGRQRGEPQPSRYEYSIRREDGEVRHVETLVSLIDYRGRPASLAFNRDITERKQMEEDIRSLARFPSENSSPVMRISEDGTILYANAASGSLLDEWRSEVGQAAPEQWRLWVSEALESGLGGDVEIQCGDRVVSFVLAPITDAGYVNIYGRDITERKAYEKQFQSLHHSAAELSRAESPDEVFKITYEAMDNTPGFEAIDVIKIEDGMLRDVLVKGPRREPLVLSMTGSGVTVRAARTGEPQYVPDVTQDPDYVPSRIGDMMSEFAVPIMVENEAVAVLNVESPRVDAFTRRDRELLEILAFHMASAFIRLRKLSERREYEERLETLHTHATELGATETIEEVAESTMNAIEEVLGFSQGGFAIVEGSLLRHIHIIGTETGETFDMPLDGPGITVRATRTGKTQLVPDIREDEDFILGPVGRELGSLSELAVPVKVEGEVFGVINVESGRLDAFTLQDQQLVETLAMHVSSVLSRLKRLDVLERLVEEKTSELLDAERMVAAGRVASMVGHDLRGPLQTINNAVYLLRRTPERSDELLSMINGAVQRASQMIEEFRSQTHDTPLKIEPTDLAALLDATVKETQIPESVKIDLRVGDGLENVSLDPLKIRRVLDNLVGNALDAMPDGGALTMIAGMEEDEIVIRVSDTGVGIPEDEKSSLFKPFHTTKKQGVGLGLSFCRRAVKAHGGTITVESKVGKGTTFTVKLPRVYKHKVE